MSSSACTYILPACIPEDKPAAAEGGALPQPEHALSSGISQEMMRGHHKVIFLLACMNHLPLKVSF